MTKELICCAGTKRSLELKVVPIKNRGLWTKSLFLLLSAVELSTVNRGLGPKCRHGDGAGFIAKTVKLTGDEVCAIQKHKARKSKTQRGE